MRQGNGLTQMQMNVHAGRLAVFPDAMRFCDDRCQLITGEREARKVQLSTGNGDFRGRVRGIAAKK
jgi:hypothetical protein